MPWKFTAGTPNILGTILSAQALRLLLDFSLHPAEFHYFMTDKKLEMSDIRKAMGNIESHEEMLIKEALQILSDIPDLTIFGPKNPASRTALIAFHVKDKSPFKIAEALSEVGVESRAGCHCATLAHHYYGLNPPASCRLSFYVYNDIEEVRKACFAVKKCLASI